MKHIASCSFGKDSLAMVLLLIEKKYPLDEVVFYDTGKEFQAIYNTRDKVLPILRSHGIAYTELKPIVPFDYKMFDKPVNGIKNGFHYGYSWCGGTCRWGTTDKLSALKKHIGNNYDYVGIAADETKRIEKEQRKNRLLPLVEWNLTEADCLEVCYQRGFYWEEQGIRLYDILKRVSCWCCGFKNLEELKNIYTYLPNYWERLKAIQSRLEIPMKGVGKSVFDLEKRFKNENHERTCSM